MKLCGGETHGHDERVRNAGDRVCELNAELTVVVVEPASGNRGDAISTSNTCLSEESCQNVPNDTTDGVGCKYLEQNQHASFPT